ncbi:hypothetical protein N9C07_05870 [Flavobacteriaceae bacterium]|nr:hypothetical protein [Flavobacteriaceae bacterium]MDC1542424.1 hypothetical protein [Flavobacteriaceae bacterium]
MKKVKLFLIICFSYSCADSELKSFIKEPIEENGGLITPNGFIVKVFADSLGPSRHLDVNKNGDVYVKLSTDKGLKVM